MKTKDVIRAWKDAGYRQNLSEADRAKLPAHPSGMIELTDADHRWLKACVFDSENFAYEEPLIADRYRQTNRLGRRYTRWILSDPVHRTSRATTMGGPVEGWVQTVNERIDRSMSRRIAAKPSPKIAGSVK